MNKYQKEELFIMLGVGVFIVAPLALILSSGGANRSTGPEPAGLQEWRQWESQHSLPAGNTVQSAQTNSLTTQQIDESARKQAQKSLAEYKKCVLLLNPTLCSIL